MAKRLFKILHLGDSYTVGTGTRRHQSWPYQLKRRLFDQCSIIVEPKIIAKSGWTTRDLLCAVNRSDFINDFDLVSVLIGVNNQFQGLDLIDFQNDLKVLLHKSVHFAQDNPYRVIVLSIPDWGETPFANSYDRHHISDTIDAFNKIYKLEALAVGGQWIDITEISRTAVSDPSLLAGDNLHPSMKLYSKWVEQILPTVQRILMVSN